MNDNPTMKLSDRLKAVIEANSRPRGRFPELAEKTSIGHESWKSFWYGRQRPTVEMIEVILLMWPQHAFWVATGRTDSENGHTAPSGFYGSEVKRVSKISLAE
jgi:hypothetical protein